MSLRRMRHVKAREFQGCDVAFDFSNPANLYDATSGGSLVAADGAIARSNDVSGGSAHATQGTSGNRPSRKVAVINGHDAALFAGGSAHSLSAGDVGDMLAVGIEACVVHKKVSSDQYPQVFGKMKATPGQGHWGFYVGTDAPAKHIFYASDTATIRKADGPANNTNTEVLFGYNARIAGTNANKVGLLRNTATLYESAAYTADTATNLNTTTILMIGMLADAAGTAALGTPGAYNGYVGEAAKWAGTFTTAMRARFSASRCRKWRIAS
jgi:hypothetical protein